MRFLRRKPRLTVDERLEAQKARTGYGWEIWWNPGDLMWRCRIDAMSGHWQAFSREHAKHLILDGYYQVPDKEDQ